MYTLQELAKKAKPASAGSRGAEAVLQPDTDIRASQAVSSSSQQDYADSDEARSAQRSWVFPVVGFSDIINWLLRFWWLILLLALVGAAVGIGFGKTAKPRFTAGSDIIVAPSKIGRAHV